MGFSMEVVGDRWVSPAACWARERVVGEGAIALGGDAGAWTPRLEQPWGAEGVAGLPLSLRLSLSGCPLFRSLCQNLTVSQVLQLPRSASQLLVL